MLFALIVFVSISQVAANAPVAREHFLEEQRLTFSARNHELDNNDNFSPDGRYLCYDTRETFGPGIDHGQTIEVLDLSAGAEIVVYEPASLQTGEAPAPGVGAASFSHAALEVAFIHGPPVAEVPERGPYAQPNRCGGHVALDGDVVERDGRLRMLRDGDYAFSWLDKRDIATNRDTLPGAHRGGTHRHEYARNSARIGFTYNDHLLPEYDRTVGYMEPHPDAPAPARCYFAALVPVAKQGSASPGDIERAYGDSWVDAAATMRAFIGKVRNEDGETYEESLFVVDIPADVDITTADSGDATRFPAPPEGVHIRRLTHDWAGGIARGSHDGKRIAYYGKDAHDLSQVFIIPAHGSDRHDDPGMRPVQVTFLPNGTEAGLRWHPSDAYISCISDGGLVLTYVAPGPYFGRSIWITPRNDGEERYAPVFSPDGAVLAYNRKVPTKNSAGVVAKNYAGENFSQIFMITLDNIPPAFLSK